MKVGFEMVEINLSDEDMVTLINRFVNTKLREASQLTFDEERKNGMNIEDALFCAIINETILEALIEQIDSATEQYLLED